MAPIQIYGNGIERIVAGKFGRVEMQRRVLPCYPQGVQNSPLCRNDGTRIIELRYGNLTESSSLSFPKNSQIRERDSRDQRVTKTRFPIAARVIAHQHERQK